MTDTHILIMAGGIGSRLWPISTPAFPKQFIDVLGVGKSLLQLTVDRFAGLCPVENFWVVTSASYVDIVRKQLPDLAPDNILAEPQARNTAPCIAYACRKIEMRHPDANVVVTPADALVLDTERFRDDILKAVEFTSAHGSIVTIGITPSRPDTGYGYIHCPVASAGGIGKVTEFCEKPDLDTAESYLAGGRFYWNAGIFVWNVRTINAQLRKFAPAIAEIMDCLAPSFYTEAETDELARLFPLCEKISIDYAVMEKSDDIYMIAGDYGWSDLGSWSSVKSHITPDESGNSVVGGDVRLFDCKDCIIHAATDGTVVVQGLDGYVVSATGKDVLVCKLTEEQHIKEYSTEKNEGRG